MSKIIREKGAKAPSSLAMEDMLNEIKQIIDFRMSWYKEDVEKNNISESYLG